MELLHELLGGPVGRMGLAGKDEHHRTLVAVDDLLQPAEIVQQQRRALVGGEAAPEADGEHIRPFRVQVLQQPVDVGLGQLVARVLPAQPVAQADEHRRLDLLADVPEAAVGNVVDLPRQVPVHQLVAPGRAEVLLQQVRPLRLHEGGDVDAIGDEANRILARAISGQFAAQISAVTWRWIRLTALTCREPVRARRVMLKPESGPPSDPKLQEALLPDTELADELPEVVQQHAPVEHVVAGRHRRVGREHGAGGHGLDGGIELESAGNQLPDPLDDLERGMAFVDVPHPRS